MSVAILHLARVPQYLHNDPRHNSQRPCIADITETRQPRKYHREANAANTARRSYNTHGERSSPDKVLAHDHKRRLGAERIRDAHEDPLNEKNLPERPSLDEGEAYECTRAADAGEYVQRL